MSLTFCAGRWLNGSERMMETLDAGLTLQIRGSHPNLLPEITAPLLTLPYLSSGLRAAVLHRH